MSSSAIGAGGVPLRYRAEGPTKTDAEGPTKTDAGTVAVILIHGWSQSLEAWDPVFESELTERFRVVAYDLRGHGHSGAPEGDGHYREGRVWADDLAAVIDATCEPTTPVVLVGWSYGGFIISDYIRNFGADRVGGICFVAASVNLDDRQIPDYLSPMFPPLAERAASDDPAEAEAAVREFVAQCTARPLAPDVFEAVVATNLLTRPSVRAALGDRLVNSDDLLAQLTVPVLIVQGTEDLIVLPATADYIAARCPTATTVYYDGIGHIPMLEATDRFIIDLAGLVDVVGRSGPGSTVP